MLKIYLDGGKGSGRWVDFPASPEEMEEAGAVFGAAASQSQYTQIGDAESSVSNLPDYLRGITVTTQTLEELDFLARRTEGMTEQEQSILGRRLRLKSPVPSWNLSTCPATWINSTTIRN